MASNQAILNLDRIEELDLDATRAHYELFKSLEPLERTDPKLVMYQDYLTKTGFTLRLAGAGAAGAAAGAAVGCGATIFFKIGLCTGGFAGACAGGLIGLALYGYYYYKNRKRKFKVPDDTTFKATKEQVQMLKDRLNKLEAEDAIKAATNDFAKEITKKDEERKTFKESIEEERKKIEQEKKNNFENIRKEILNEMKETLKNDHEERYQIKVKENKELKETINNLIKENKELKDEISTFKSTNEELRAYNKEILAILRANPNLANPNPINSA